jgi:nucleoside-diphosphate-sugar epimerase
VRVLVTGAFGNIGRNTVEALVAQKAQVRALRYGEGVPDLLKKWRGRVEVVGGDVTDATTLAPAVRGVDVVVHLAYVIPPECLEQPEASRRVNVDGTANLIAAMKAEAPKAKLLFASSLDVFGHTAHLPPPRTLKDPVSANDVYTEHKLACEALVQESGLTWAIFRYADVPPIELRSPIPIMFEIPLKQRIECLHPLDAGFVTARASLSDATWGRHWLIGGGKSCQLTYGEYLSRFLGAMEMGGPLPEAAFTTQEYCTDWLDTAESQKVFQYQKRSFDDIVKDISALLGWKRGFAKLSQPVVREYMLSLSPYYRKRKEGT